MLKAEGSVKVAMCSEVSKMATPRGRRKGRKAAAVAHATRAAMLVSILAEAMEAVAAGFCTFINEPAATAEPRGQQEFLQ